MIWLQSFAVTSSERLRRNSGFREISEGKAQPACSRRGLWVMPATAQADPMGMLLLSSVRALRIAVGWAETSPLSPSPTELRWAASAPRNTRAPLRHLARRAAVAAGLPGGRRAGGSPTAGAAPDQAVLHCGRCRTSWSPCNSAECSPCDWQGDVWSLISWCFLVFRGMSWI